MCQHSGAHLGCRKCLSLQSDVLTFTSRSSQTTLHVDLALSVAVGIKRETLDLTLVPAAASTLGFRQTSHTTQVVICIIGAHWRLTPSAVSLLQLARQASITGSQTNKSRLMLSTRLCIFCCSNCVATEDLLSVKRLYVQWPARNLPSNACT